MAAPEWLGVALLVQRKASHWSVPAQLWPILVLTLSQRRRGDLVCVAGRRGQAELGTQRRARRLCRVRGPPVALALPLRWPSRCAAAAAATPAPASSAAAPSRVRKQGLAAVVALLATAHTAHRATTFAFKSQT